MAGSAPEVFLVFFVLLIQGLLWFWVGFIFWTAAVGCYYACRVAAARSLIAAIFLGLLFSIGYAADQATRPPPYTPEEIQAELRRDPSWEDDRAFARRELGDPFGSLLILWLLPLAFSWVVAVYVFVLPEAVQVDWTGKPRARPLAVNAPNDRDQTELSRT